MRQKRKGNIQRIQCAQCDKTFSKTEHLNRHQLAHTGERPYKCSICTKQFARRDVLLRHRRNHTIENAQRVPNHSVDPFEPHAPFDPAYDPTSDLEDHDLLVPTGMPEPTGMTPAAASNAIPITQAREQVPVDGGTHDYPALGNGSNPELLNLLFNSSFGQPLNTNVPQPALDPPTVPSSSIVEGLIPRSLVPEHIEFSPTGSMSSGGGAEGVVNKIQNTWPPSSKAAVTQIYPGFWQDVAFGSLENIFASHSMPGELDSTQIGFENTGTSEIILTQTSKMRLHMFKRKLLHCGCNDFYETSEGLKCGLESLCINTIQVFEQGLYLYSRKYQPVYPVLHTATFNVDKASDLLLCVMSMIGISFLKTDDAVVFIKRFYPVVLNEVYTQLVFAAVDCETPNRLLEYLVLAHHTLFLFISTGGHLHPEKSRGLYLQTMIIAQQHGFFSAKFDHTEQMLLLPQFEEGARWIAWSRVESAKNLIIGLVLHDSWLSELFSVDPIIPTDALVVYLPMEIDLYKASTSSEWSQLIDRVKPLNQRIELSTHEFHLPELQGPIHVLSMYGLLCSVLLRVFADTRRLVANSDLIPPGKHQYVPWNICRLDKRAGMLSPLLMKLIQVYDTTLRDSNPNCIVIWHSVCMLLTSDINVLSRASGRDGPEYMYEARQALRSWAYTPSARRACLHAAQSFRILSHRKPADGTAFQSVRTLFMSALILGFYLLVSQEIVCLESPSGLDPFDLANSIVDWRVIGDEGMSNLECPSHDPVKLEDPAVRFIRFGGPILIDGKRYEPGARHAQRILLEFAGLLDEVGTHWMASYAQLLYMIHDTMITP